MKKKHGKPGISNNKIQDRNEEIIKLLTECVTFLRKRKTIVLEEKSEAKEALNELHGEKSEQIEVKKISLSEARDKLIKIQEEIKSLMNTHNAYLKEIETKIASTPDIKERNALRKLETVERLETLEKYEKLRAEFNSISVDCDVSSDELEEKLKTNLRNIKTIVRGYH